MRLKAVVVLLSAAFLFMSEPARADSSYRVTMREKTKVGSIQLKPGEYSLAVRDSKVRFTDQNTGKVFEVDATIDNSAEAKYQHTSIDSRIVDGTRQVTEIHLAGTKTKLKFP